MLSVCLSTPSFSCLTKFIFTKQLFNFLQTSVFNMLCYVYTSRLHFGANVSVGGQFIFASMLVQVIWVVLHLNDTDAWFVQRCWKSLQAACFNFVSWFDHVLFVFTCRVSCFVRLLLNENTLKTMLILPILKRHSEIIQNWKFLKPH